MIFQEYINKSDLNVKKISEITGLTEKTIRDTINEETTPCTIIFSKLANVLKMSDDDIYEYLMLYLDYNKIMQ